MKILENFSKYKIVVLSGGNRFDVTTSLRVNDLLEKCDLVVTADDTYPPKDDPQTYQQLAKALEVPVEDCHFFEDGYYAIKAARQAGMQVTDVVEFLEESEDATLK